MALVILYLLNGVLVRWKGLGWTAQMAEAFPHYEALETANDLGLALALRHAVADVINRGLMVAYAHDDHAVGGWRCPVGCHCG
jgi:hypothetical protein